MIECLEKRHLVPNDATIKSAIDVELDGFTQMMSIHLKKLPLITRLKAQQDMLHIVSEALRKEENNLNSE